MENSLLNGIVKLPYPLSLKEAIIGLAENAWPAFCAQSLEEKMKYPFINDSGYEFREGKDGEDAKETIHIRPGENPTLARTDTTEADRNLWAAAEKLFAHQEMVAIFLQEFVNAGGDPSVFDPKKVDVVLRLLHYFPGSSVLAASHPDKGLGTVHLHESAGGFEYFWDGEWHPCSFQEGESVAFAGLQGQFLSEGKVKGLYHRVVATDLSAKEGRYAAVLFHDCVMEKKWNKNVLGRTQDLQPGETYNMPKEEFEKCFTLEKVIA